MTETRGEKSRDTVYLMYGLMCLVCMHCPAGPYAYKMSGLYMRCLAGLWWWYIVHQREKYMMELFQTQIFLKMAWECGIFACTRCCLPEWAWLSWSWWGLAGRPAHLATASAPGTSCTCNISISSLVVLYSRLHQNQARKPFDLKIFCILSRVLLTNILE
jgi:hypothetical protein